ncbi:MAG: hypothetical protein ACYTG2_10275 [Planctomycetota bacterium]|jgi:hypothetical protein
MTRAHVGRKLIAAASAQRARLAALVVSFGVAAGPSLMGQVADQLLVYSNPPGPAGIVLRIDRRLDILGQSSVPSLLQVSDAVSVDGSGCAWISGGFDSLFRLASDGTPLAPVFLGQYVRSVAVSATGDVYALTGDLGPYTDSLFKLDADGGVVWESSVATSPFKGHDVTFAALTPDQELWLGGNVLSSYQPILVRIDPRDGAVLRQFDLPHPTIHSTLTHLAADPDGSLWNLESIYLVHSSYPDVLGAFMVDAGYNGVILQVRVDAHGDLWAASTHTPQGAYGSHLLKFSGTDGSLLEEHSAGSLIVGFALGASGEDLFVATASLEKPNYRLMRINLATGVKSARALDPYQSVRIADGDPTGFIFANVVDQFGDNDGDGATNRQETLAGSSPYDPASRPDGPDVYIAFAPATNALVLELVDPDGLFDPVGGLDLATLSVRLGPHGEVLDVLLSFLSSVQVSPDRTRLTAHFDALPFASDLRWEVEVTVTDKTGAVGWDWQVTPPGEL